MTYADLEPDPTDVAACCTLMRQYAKSFYWAGFMLPTKKRNAVTAIYAFCRVCDNLADQNPPKMALKRLLEYEHELRKAFQTGQSTDKIIRAFVQTMNQYRIPKRLAYRLITGLQKDVVKNCFETFKELKQYCMDVAGIPGLMLLPVLGFSSPRAKRHAVQLGIAMQLTNILRDVSEDLKRNKIYLPKKDLKRFSCTKQDLANSQPSLRLKKVLQFESERAQKYYQKSLKGIWLLDLDSRLCILLAHALYRQILLEIKAQRFEILSKRVFVPAWKKTVLTIAVPIQHALGLHSFWDTA